MIFVTGDTHGQLDFAKLTSFLRDAPRLTKDDYMIIAGDFSAVWSEKTLEEDLKPYCDLPFTVLFVDGNHENFDLLNAYPVEEWKGGKVHIVKPDIIHLMRGQVFEIEGKTFFTFGGATSMDKATRRAHNLGWWAQELPTYEELDEGFRNLKRYHNKVDFIITHACGERALMYPPLRSRSFHMEPYFENHILSNFEDIAEYSHWYFGHYHLDGDLNDKMTVLYRKIIRIV